MQNRGMKFIRNFGYKHSKKQNRKFGRKTGLPVPTPTGRMAGGDRLKGVQSRTPNPDMLYSGLINPHLVIMDTVKKYRREEISTYAR